ncbi:MAG: DUF4197 domain-containing protein [Candidatus Aminicenantaceae bacterium]
MIKRIIPIALIMTFAGCAELMQIAEQADTRRPLTQQEVINGLKQALTIGADSAASKLSAVDGYYRDNLVKIMLPPEAEVITGNISLIPGGEKMVENVILRINRAAENAAKEAAPVFAGAVSNMTIHDGFEILRGEKDAATQYLKVQTYGKLYNLYLPKIKNSIDKTIVGGISTAESWELLTGHWNTLAGSTAGKIAGLKTVDIELDRYLTEQALKGLFLKLAQEEEKIRTDPAARVTELLKRVFGFRA